MGVTWLARLGAGRRSSCYFPKLTGNIRRMTPRVVSAEDGKELKRDPIFRRCPVRQFAGFREHIFTKGALTGITL
jgi:hypothetical protein